MTPPTHIRLRHAVGAAWQEMRAGAHPAIFAALAGVSLLAFIVLVILVQSGVILPSDTAMLALFALERTPARDLFAHIVSEVLMFPQVLLLLLPGAGTLYRAGRRAQVVGFLAIPLAGAITIRLAKYAFHRQRPPTAHFFEPTEGFPSGHAIAAVIVYGLLGYLLWRFAVRRAWPRALLAAAVIILILLSGVVRLYQQVHYPSDIFGGYALGLVFLWGGLAVLEAQERHASQQAG